MRSATRSGSIGGRQHARATANTRSSWPDPLASKAAWPVAPILALNGLVHFLVTNKHVLEGATELSLQFVSEKDGQPDFGKPAVVGLFPFHHSQWFGHPEPEIDVAVLPLGPALDGLVKAGHRPFFRALPESLVPNPAAIAELDAIERVTFIGYPAGRYDSVNLTPIARQGFTATPIALDNEGLPQFIIDAAVFPGSSGSPVFLFDRGMVVDRKGNVIMGGGRLYLLGVLAAVHRDEIEADIENAADKLVARFDQLLGLGIVFRTETIDQCVDLALERNGFKRGGHPLDATPQTPPTEGTAADRQIAKGDGKDA
jgi:hypothetical protein